MPESLSAQVAALESEVEYLRWTNEDLRRALRLLSQTVASLLQDEIAERAAEEAWRGL